MDPKQPLGLPEGSVRAILAIISLVTACAMVLTGEGNSLPEWFAAIIGGTIGSYFAVRPGKEG